MGRVRYIRSSPMLLILIIASSATCATPGSVLFPYVTGQPGHQLFAPHPGWLGLFAPGASRAVMVPIARDGTFQLEPADGPFCVIAGFDQLETLPLIMSFGQQTTDFSSFEVDLAKHYDYVCMPPGYPETWDTEYMVRDHSFDQTFIAASRWLYSVTVFDGPKIVEWGNKVFVWIREDGADGPFLDLPTGGEPGASQPFQAAIHSDHAFPRVGFRHGDVELVPGRKYSIRVTGYQSHGGQHFLLDAFLRPDNNDGYLPGQAYVGRVGQQADLCMFVAGNATGQIVENQIRTPEWEILIPRLAPSMRWGQTFRSHGVSMAGVRFWGGSGDDEPVACTVQIRREGPHGEPVGPAKTAVSTQPPPIDHPDMSPGEIMEYLRAWSGVAAGWQPLIRYPEGAGLLEGHEQYYLPPYKQFLAAWLPDETPLTPGETYYLDIRPSRPLMLFADGDAYEHGELYHEGEAVRDTPLFHSRRCTLAATIVTYENPGGGPTGYPQPVPEPETDGNLVRNPGAESGDFRGWNIIGDPAIDPGTHVPQPPNHGGNHRFGMSVGWQAASMGQFQEIAVTPGTALQAGLWVSHQDGTDEQARLLWIDGGFGGEEQLLAQTGEGPMPTWQLLEGPPFTPTKSRITLVIRYLHPYPTNIASIHVDDVYLREVGR